MSALDLQLTDLDTIHGDQMNKKKCKKFSTILESNGVEFLLRGQEKVPVSSVEGKNVCLYFSAEWCRPCKRFTPQLVQIYNKLKKRGENIEIVFVSFDRNKQGFDEHLKCMPWFAVPFDITLHRGITDYYKVDHIPSFVPLDLDGKLIVEDDVVAMIEDYGVDAFPFTKARIEKLKALDYEKSRGGKIEELLANEGRNYLTSRYGKKVHLSELVGKTIGLYFGAHWCPPCHVFTSQLTQVYNELCINSNQCFEIVFIWGMISSYGAKGFPFTQKRIDELETELRKEGERFAFNVKDSKHEHVLKLDMAKAYLCDFCKKQGRFWAYSCDVCDYDLHPTCIEHPCE